METFEVKTGRTLEVVQKEAEKLNKLILEREDWLSNPLNWQNPTYDDVNRDTRKMIWDLKDLQDEINELK